MARIAFQSTKFVIELIDAGYKWRGGVAFACIHERYSSSLEIMPENKIRIPKELYRPSLIISLWQVFSTAALWFGLWVWVDQTDSIWVNILCFFLSGMLIMRLFVLQHDCGHQNLFLRSRTNDIVGHVLAWITTVPYELWRSEHRWHHLHQGNLSKRGVDSVNSPPTVEEAKKDPHLVDLAYAKVSTIGVMIYGIYSIGFRRRSYKGFFLFREKFKWEVPKREELIRSIWVTHIGAFILQALLCYWLGWATYFLVVFPSYFLTGGLGSLLFWIQHNFEHSYFEWNDDWEFQDAALHGSSYIKFFQPFTWFTANIGLHHVHHLNMKIPNYRLEAVRRAIPEVAAVEPLTWSDFRRSFICLFWDEEKKRKVSLKPDSQ